MKIRLVKAPRDFPCTYDLYRNDRYIGYIAPSIYGYEAVLIDGRMSCTGPSFSCVLRMVCTYGKN